MPDTNSYYRQSFPDENRAFRSWRWRAIPLDAASLDKMAAAEASFGNFQFAERLAWRAAALREAA